MRKHENVHKFDVFDVLVIIIFAIGVGTIIYGAFCGCRKVVNAFVIKHEESTETAKPTIDSDDENDDSDTEDELT